MNLYRFFMNPDNAILITALIAFLVGIGMNFMIAGTIIAIVLVLFQSFVVLAKKRQQWPPVKTLCPDQYYVHSREQVPSQSMGGSSMNELQITCKPMQGTKIELGNENAQNTDFVQTVQDVNLINYKEVCTMAEQQGLQWEACG